MIIVGLCGAAGAGKDTVAEILRDTHDFAAESFAAPLYAAVAAMTGIPVDRLRDRAFKEQPIAWLGAASPRRLLQTLGTEWGRGMIADHIWITLAERRVAEIAGQGGRAVVFSDVRFPNEATSIRSMGGLVWEVRRDGASCLHSDAAGHASEQGLPRNLIDGVIHNNAGIADLQAAVDSLFRRQFRAGKRSVPV